MSCVEPDAARTVADTHLAINAVCKPICVFVIFSKTPEGEQEHRADGGSIRVAGYYAMGMLVCWYTRMVEFSAQPSNTVHSRIVVHTIVVKRHPSGGSRPWACSVFCVLQIDRLV